MHSHTRDRLGVLAPIGIKFAKFDMGFGELRIQRYRLPSKAFTS